MERIGGRMKWSGPAGTQNFLVRTAALAAAPFAGASVVLLATGPLLHESAAPALFGLIGAAILAVVPIAYGVTLWKENSGSIRDDKTLVVVTYGSCAALAGIGLLFVLSAGFGLTTFLIPVATGLSIWPITKVPKELPPILDKADSGTDTSDFWN